MKLTDFKRYLQSVADKITFAKVCFLLITFLSSCLIPIDRSSDYIGGQIVISGQISPLQETNVITLGRTAFTERLPQPVTGAFIWLFDDHGNENPYLEDAEYPGTYRLQNVVGVPGRTYFIRVFTSSGEAYESVPEKMPEDIGEDVIFYSLVKEDFADQDGIVKEQDFVKIYTTASLPETDNLLFLKWHIEEVYLLSPTDFPDPFGSVPQPCFITQQVDAQRIVLFNGEEIKTNSISEMLVASRIVDRSFKERHYFNTYQSSMTRDAYQYWRKVDVVANQVGSIFDSPPARITGNIFNADRHQEVLGYFQAVNQKLKRFYLLPQDFPFKMTQYCEYGPDRFFENYPSECLDCRSVRNSSYVRPEWF